MIVTLPTKNGNIDFQLDTSAYADYRFELHFGNQLNCSFQEYLQRIAKKQDYLSALKALFCYLESDKAPTFIDFIKLFDPTKMDMEEAKNRIVKAFEEVYNQAQKSAVKN